MAAASAVLPCPLCETSGEVLETNIDEEADAEEQDPENPGTPPASVTCPLCDGDGIVPAGVGFEDLTDGGEDGGAVLDGGAAEALREFREWIAAIEDGNAWGAS